MKITKCKRISNTEKLGHYWAATVVTLPSSGEFDSDAWTASDLAVGKRLLCSSSQGNDESVSYAYVGQKNAPSALYFIDASQIVAIIEP